MAKLILASVLCIFLLVKGVSGADKELGEMCASGDMCVHPSLELTCDAFAKKCLIQQDKICNGDGHKYLCVTGAECDGTSNKCACKTATYSASGVNCTVAEDKYAGACPSSGTCTGTTLLCANSFCGCADATFIPKLSDGTCEAIAASKVGKVCTTDGSGGECGDPASTFLSCPAGSGTRTCTCNAGYAGPVGGVCAVIDALKVGKACTADTVAANCGAQATTNLECGTTPAVCKCVANYYGVPGGDCYPAKGQLNGGCTATSDCSTVTNTVCTGSPAKKCECKSGYSADTAGTACEVTATKVGGSCTTSGAVNVQGTCEDANALCPGAADGTCFCKTGYTGTDGATCVVTANTFTGACTGGPNVKGTCVDANGVCSDATGTCGCKAKYAGAVGASCVMDNQVGGTCSGADKGTCTDTNALCTSTKCTCKPGYDGSAGGTCTKIADNTFGGSCTTDTANTKGTCVDANAQCSATTGGVCTCKANYDGYAGSGCAMANKLGGKCTTMTKGTKGTCESAGAVCSMQVDGRCVMSMSGAKAVVASVTSLVLACIVCLLAIN